MNKAMSEGSRLLLPVLLLLPPLACTKPEPPQKLVEYGDAVGIEFGDPTSGRFLAAVAAEKGHSPEKGVPSLAAALHEASKGCPTLAKEAADQKSAPTLHFTVKGNVLEAMPATPSDAPSVACMTKSMNGKAANLEGTPPYELTIQLLAKKAGE
jgi:hypothetical protein